MKNTIVAILILLCGAAGARAQTPYVPTCLTPAQIATVKQSTAALAPILLFDETDAALRLADQACSNMQIATGLLADVATLKASSSSHEARITKLEQAAPTPGPQGIPGPAGLSAPHELMLVIPYGSTGFSITTLGALSEYPPVQRTRRIVDFSNVKQLRLCANIIAPGGAGSFFQLEAGPSWSVLTSQFSMTAAGLSCSAWQNYSGPLGDQMVRISAAGSNSVTLDFISVQFK